MKPSRPPERNESKNRTDRNKGKASYTNNYRGKKHRNNPSPKPEAGTDFKGRCTDLKGYIFDLGPRSSDKGSQTMKELK